MTEAIVLIGFKSSGKSTYGAMLAESTGAQFADLDRLLESVHAGDSGTMCPAHRIFSDLGSARFAALEQHALRRFIAATAGSLPHGSATAVLATTGATPLDPVNLGLLRRLGPLILIDTPRDVIRQRWFADRMPAFVDPGDPEASFGRLYAERAPLYGAVADAIVETASRSDDDVIAEIRAVAADAAKARSG